MISRPTIAVVGASVRAAAFSLLRAGHSVVSADLFADADLRRACPAERVTNYPHGLADWLALTECDEWLYTGALENYPDLVDRMATLRPLHGNSGSVLRAVRDPLLLQESLNAGGFNFPETHLCTGLPPETGQWLHKTGNGASGSGVSEMNVANLPTEGFWQRHISGTTGSAVFLASARSCQLLGITRQLVGETWTGARQFQYCGTVAPWQLPKQVASQINRVGEVISHHFKLRGLFGFDFIFDGTKVWPVEVNPRTTAAVEIVERAAATQLSSGKAILYAKHPLMVSRATSDQLLDRAGPLEHPQLADIPSAGTQITPGEPIITVFADGNSLAEVEAALRLHVARLKTELYISMVQ